MLRPEAASAHVGTASLQATGRQEKFPDGL